MKYDKKLIAGKLRKWEKNLDKFRLPAWEDIPDIGLYMDQLIPFLKQYLDYLPPELKEEQFITPATINNYVRKKIMPQPIKKRYYRTYLAYLLVICSLKQTLSIATVSTLIPLDLSAEELKEFYTSYVTRHMMAVQYFVDQVRIAAGGILDHEYAEDITTSDTGELVVFTAVVGGFCRLLAEKLLLLEGKRLEDIHDDDMPIRPDGSEK